MPNELYLLVLGETDSVKYCIRKIYNNNALNILRFSKNNFNLNI